MLAYASLIDDRAELLKFNELVERYQIEMLRIARSILHDYHLAEDAVQNALSGIAVSFSKIPSEDPDAAHTYFLSCAKHAALRIKKTAAKIPTTEITDLTSLAEDDDPTFETIARSEDYDRLLSAIRQLDEIYQDALLHYYVFDQRVKEIAKLFGEKPSTIRQRLSRGRKLLTELCRKEGILHG